MLFEGPKEKFKGFSEVEYLEDYEKVGDSIDIYTSYTNPIPTTNITPVLILYFLSGGCLL